MSLDFDSALLHNPHLTAAHEEWRSQLRRFLDTEVAPYIGVNWERQFGNTADFTRVVGRRHPRLVLKSCVGQVDTQSSRFVHGAGSV